MKKSFIKTVSFILAAALLLSFPVCVQAAPSGVGTVSADVDYDNTAELSWAQGDCAGYKVYKSFNNADYFLAATIFGAENNYWSDTVAAKQISYYYVTAFDASYEESVRSSSTKVIPKISSLFSYSYCYDVASAVQWQANAEDLKYIDGFEISRSMNGGAFVSLAKIGVSSYNITTEYYNEYIYNDKLSANAGETCTYKITPYFIANWSFVYFNESASESSVMVPMLAPALTTKAKTVTVKWKGNPNATRYELWCVKYKKVSGGYSQSGGEYRVASLGADKTSYTVKNLNNSKYSYEFYVKCFSSNICFVISEHSYSSDTTARMRAATKRKSGKNRYKINVINTRGKKNKVAWTVTLSSKDKKILKDFASKHFEKGWSNAQKAQYVLSWINQNVTYASKKSYSSINKKSYVEAIFKYKKGQCLQYNGAYAAFLVYLGYDARIIQGWRGNSAKNKWSHYWCEINCGGIWYLMETGNYGDSGSWSYFCESYNNAGGYIMNGKIAK